MFSTISKVPTAQGKKTGKMTKKNPCQGKHRELVVDALILKVKNIAIFAAKISPKKRLCLPSQFCVCNSHKTSKSAQGKFSVGQGKISIMTFG